MKLLEISRVKDNETTLLYQRTISCDQNISKIYFDDECLRVYINGATESIIIPKGHAILFKLE